MPEITVTVPGPPIAKKRPRFARKGRFVQTYNCQETEEGRWLTLFISELRKSLKEDFPIIGKGAPVFLSCDFIMPMPTSMPKRKQRAIAAGEKEWHTKKPDSDNCLKFVKDCLNNVMWNDDSQVVRTFAQKFYGPAPKTIIRVVW